jgi:hypothetical protein
VLISSTEEGSKSWCRTHRAPLSKARLQVSTSPFHIAYRVSTTYRLSSDNTSGIWNPSNPPSLDENDEANDEIDDDEVDDEDYDEYYGRSIAEWKETRKPVHPSVPEFEDIDYAQRDTARLAQKFKKTGLQVIVKMTSIELTPEKPEFTAGEWHVSNKCNRPNL